MTVFFEKRARDEAPSRKEAASHAPLDTGAQKTPDPYLEPPPTDAPLPWAEGEAPLDLQGEVKSTKEIFTEQNMADGSSFSSTASGGQFSHSDSGDDVRAKTAGPGQAQLYAGAGTRLTGEITACDALNIEGSLDGKATARQLFVSASGSFVGTAEVEEAEIEGRFEGTLSVKGRLLVRGTGRVSGDVIYGELEVERGGQLLGELSSQEQRHSKTDGPKQSSTPPLSAVPSASVHSIPKNPPSTGGYE